MAKKTDKQKTRDKPKKDTQSKKYFLTINNPLKYGFPHNVIAENLLLFNPVYYAMCDEIGLNEKTPHTHIFFEAQHPMRWSTVKGRFPPADIEKARGSSSQCRDYLLKIGTPENIEKQETIVEGSFEEWGEISKTSSEKKDTKYAKLLQDIKDGKSTEQIINDDPTYWNKKKNIDELRSLYLSKKYLTENRLSLEIVFVEGPAGCGKTRMVYDLFDFSSIARITSYNSKRGVIFDNYDNFQDVLVFDDFDSKNVPLVDMLGYLDIYPIMLPARYYDRVACYTKVFIISNIPYEFQYSIEREWEPEKYRAFDRRIKKRIKYNTNGTITYFKKDENGLWERYEPNNEEE